ncbi:hypothetical protein [Massilia timonae]|uniref:hypothetical protein n=1 Tax=Massilia timonae TaxID=47229 RepID=UPI0028D482BF|nr:hypothetical protein [Massilia timonae]
MHRNAVDFAERAILSYLEQRPASADTTEGIHHHWIAWEGLPEHIDITACALARLRDAGRMQSVRLGDRTIWRLHRQA